LSVEFLRNIDEIYNKEISSEVIARSKRSLLDYIAVTCAGSKFQKVKLDKYVDFALPEEGAFKAIGTKMNLALKEVVFLNGLNAHALDLDDGTNSGIIHLGSPIFSVLLPLAQRFNLGVNAVLKAAIAGYEASYTLAVSIQPSHKALGYHATGTCGVIGATIAASYMLDFSEEERFRAFSTACVSSSGMLKVLDDGSELKPYNVAKAALLSLASLQMAKAGFEGSADPLGGQRGFLKMMTGSEHRELKPVLLNGTYAVMKSYTKPYASCRYTHPAVEAAIRLRHEYDIKPDDVFGVDIRTYDLAIPGHDHTEISNSYSAKMSIPYSTAVGLIFGKAGLMEFDEECIIREDVLKLTKKIQVKADEELSSEFPNIQAAIVSVQTKSGIVTERVDFPKGEPENPLTDEEFRVRYDELMSHAGIDPENGSFIFDAVYRGSSVEDILEIL
jgi:2-methylcitrate dehydratase PrpD